MADKYDNIIKEIWREKLSSANSEAANGRFIDKNKPDDILIGLMNGFSGTIGCPKCGSSHVYCWVNSGIFECDDCNEQWDPQKYDICGKRIVFIGVGDPQSIRGYKKDAPRRNEDMEANYDNADNAQFESISQEPMKLNNKQGFNDSFNSREELLTYIQKIMPIAIKPKNNNAKKELVSPFTSRNAFEIVCEYLANKLFNDC